MAQLGSGVHVEYPRPLDRGPAWRAGELDGELMDGLRQLDAVLAAGCLSDAHFADGGEGEAGEDLGPAAVGEPRGRYLCETCFDAMTDDVCPAASSPTGLEMAQCPACAGHTVLPAEP